MVELAHVNGDEDVQSLVLLPGVGTIVELFRRVFARYKSTLGQFLIETLGRGAVDIEVQCLGRRGQGEQG